MDYAVSTDWSKPICNNPIFLDWRLIVFIIHQIWTEHAFDKICSFYFTLLHSCLNSLSISLSSQLSFLSLSFYILFFNLFLPICFLVFFFFKYRLQPKSAYVLYLKYLQRKLIWFIFKHSTEKIKNFFSLSLKASK